MLKIRITFFLFFFTLLTLVMADAENLIRQGGMENIKNGECRLLANYGCVTLSQFTEPGSWNKCVKLEVAKCYERNGRKQLNGRIVIGGVKKHFGFKVKPDTIYDYSLSIKGKGTRVFVGAVGWTANKKFWQLKKLTVLTKVGQVPLSKDWVTYKGSFKTGLKTVSAAITVTFWGDAKNNQLKEKTGDYVLVDNVSVYERQILKQKIRTLSSFSPGKRILSAVLSTKQAENWNIEDASGGFTKIKSYKLPFAKTFISAQAGPEKLNLMIKCFELEMKKIKSAVSQAGAPGDKVWRDDLVEIFFDPVGGDRKLSQFVVTAGGGKWMGYGNIKKIAQYSQWQAKVKHSDKFWTVELKIPYSLLGWKKRPAAGTLIGFNVTRQRPAFKEYTSWSKIDHNFHDRTKYGKLLIGTTQALFEKEKTALAQKILALSEKDQDKYTRKLVSLKKIESAEKLFKAVNAFKKDLKLAVLSKRKFAVTELNPTSISTVVPLLPANMTTNTPEIKLKGAINEVINLPLAITNLTDKIEEYRVVTYYGEDDGQELMGLKGKNVFLPPDKIASLRAIRVKDGEGGIHNQRFDPLVSMDKSYTVFAGPKDSALVWLQFDTTGLKPGKYTGKIRVLPLSEPTKMTHNHATKVWGIRGQVMDLPVTLDVLPVRLSAIPRRPLFLWRDALNEKFFKRMVEEGVRVFQVSPWRFKFKYNSDGTIASIDETKAEKTIRQHLRWAEKYKIRSEIRFAVVYSAYQAFESLNPKLKRGTAKWKNAWKAYMRGIADVFRRCGVDPAKSVVEIQDEPRSRNITEQDLLELCVLAKKAAPALRTMLTLDAEYNAADYAKLLPVLDVWCFWSGLFNRADIRKFCRKLKANKRSIWIYRCAVGISMELYSYYRCHAWLGEFRDVEVISMYHFIPGYCGEYGTTQWKRLNDGALAYRSFDECLTSIRNEALKIGVTDLRYLKKLQELTSLAEQRKLAPGLVKEAKKLIANMPKTIITQNYKRSNADEFRKKAIELILSLQKTAKVD